MQRGALCIPIQAVGTDSIVYIHKGGPCIRNPSLDTILLTQPRNEVAYLDESCEQKHDKGQ